MIRSSNCKWSKIDATISNTMVITLFSYYWQLYLLISIFIPTAVPVFAWNESWLNSFLYSYVMRYLHTLHAVWLVNSAAHMFGDRQYSPRIAPTTLWSMSLMGGGEGEPFNRVAWWRNGFQQVTTTITTRFRATIKLTSSAKDSTRLGCSST